MPRYLDFITHSEDPTMKAHLKAAMYRPLHTGSVPPRFMSASGVRVNGEAITFTDETTVDRLHKALVEGYRIDQLGAPFDCTTFVMLMAGVDVYSLAKQGPLEFITNKAARLTGDETLAASGEVVEMGSYRGSGDEPRMVHFASSAFTNEVDLFLHKVGAIGPVCLSELSEAKTMFRSTLAQRVTETTIECAGRSVEQWQAPTVV